MTPKKRLRVPRWLFPPPGPRRWLSLLLLIPLVWVARGIGRDVLPAPPWARHANAATVLDGRIYAVGGLSHWNRDTGRDVDLFDPVTETWRAGPALPEGRAFSGAATVGSRMYVLGGLAGPEWGEGGGTTGVFVWSEGRWATGPPLLWGVDRFVGVSDGRRIYAVGGIARGENTRTVQVFDPAASAWDTLPTMAEGRHGAAAVFLDGDLYVIGGYSPRPSASVEAFDFETRTWSSKAPLLVPRGFAGAGTVDGHIYVFGGRVNDARVITERYDPASDTWTAVAPIPEWRDRFASVVHEDRIWLIGGEADFGGVDGRDVLIYEPAVDRWERLDPTR